MNVRPLGDKVLVERSTSEQQTPGGIVLPDSAKEKPTQGIVIAVGPGTLRDNGNRNEMSVQKGDKVIFRNYAGNEITVGTNEYTILSESEVLAIVEE